MLRSFCAVVLSSVLLSGCMFFETSADRQLRHQPNFRVGYEDGCATATNEGANMRYGDTVRDDALYDPTRPIAPAGRPAMARAGAWRPPARARAPFTTRTRAPGTEGVSLTPY